ncbi:MAG: Peptidase Ste24p [Proteobacteria bacterium]|nr:Peptidase Ste24p [Pseudomonadota bacterium]
MKKAFRLAAAFMAGIVAISSLQAASNLPELGDAASEELSLAMEKRIGQQIMHDIRAREPSYLDDTEIEGYLNQIGSRLAAASSDPGIGFYFFPIDDASINAFAMPGGYIGVHTGLLLAAQTESELAGVIAHEIAHVTQRHIARQIQREKQVSMASMLMMGLALLAARSNTQMASAAMASAQASSIQAQLSFSRDFERESDRAGFETLQKAGFDVRGMSNFFQRLQRATRIYENNAPVYLRSHPLTGERISDMQNREQHSRYRQVADSADFHFVRAKLRASKGTAADAIKDFQALVQDRKYPSEAAAHYGLAVALLRNRDWTAAESQVLAAKKFRAVSPMLERIHAESRIGQGDAAGGLKIYQDAIVRYPQNAALVYAYGDALFTQKRFSESQKLAEERLRLSPQDIQLLQLLAKSFAALGRPSQNHRVMGESYAIQGQTMAAIEQLELAQRSPDANFYEQSVIDARLRELKRLRVEEEKDKHK